MNISVLVVIGAGGIGLAIARREGAGKTILLADVSEKALTEAAQGLENMGYTVQTQVVDIASRESVHALAQQAAALGDVLQVIQAAGLSPNMAAPDKILAVDLYGNALVLEEFRQVIAEGGAGIVISSMAGHMPPALGQAADEALARTPADELLALPMLQPANVPDSGAVYALSKRANQLRVQQESLHWGERGARLNSISPGIILTPLAQHEMNSPIGDAYRAMIKTSVAKRVGTADEVAAAAAYLLSPAASFVTGSDLLIDGGVIAALRAGKLSYGG